MVHDDGLGPPGGIGVQPRVRYDSVDESVYQLSDAIDAAKPVVERRFSSGWVILLVPTAVQQNWVRIRSTPTSARGQPRLLLMHQSEWTEPSNIASARGVHDRDEGDQMIGSYLELRVLKRPGVLAREGMT